MRTRTADSAIDDHQRGARDVGALAASPDDGPSGGPARTPGQDEHLGRPRPASDRADRGTLRTRLLVKRLDGLLDEPRLGVPRTVSDADVERMLTRTLAMKPADARH
jgi:hypothetical protein